MKTTIQALALATFGVVAVPAQAETFDGPYVGASIGWNRDEVDRSLENIIIDPDASQDSFVIEAHAGYNHRIADKFLIGAEASVYASADDDFVVANGGATTSINPRYSFDLAARAGYLATEKTLLFVRGGYTNARVSIATAAANGVVRNSENLDGWTIGGGVERAITDTISARLEYRYSDLGNNGGGFDRHQTLIGVSYNF